jgi:hypothetical protein
MLLMQRNHGIRAQDFQFLERARIPTHGDDAPRAEVFRNLHG